MTAVIAGDSIKPFLGHFQYIGAENLEAWLKAVGQNFIMRKLSLQCSPSADLERVIKDDGKELYISSMESFFRAVRNEFELNQHFEEDLLDQRWVDAVWTWEEDRKCLKTVHVDKNGVETVIERTMDEEKEDVQNVVIRTKDVQCKNFWKKESSQAE